MSTNTERVHNAHEHLRHDATSDPNEEVRERLRLQQLAAEREIDQADQDQADQDQTIYQQA